MNKETKLIEIIKQIPYFFFSSFLFATQFSLLNVVWWILVRWLDCVIENMRDKNTFLISHCVIARLSFLQRRTIPFLTKKNLTSDTTNNITLWMNSRMKKSLFPFIRMFLTLITWWNRMRLCFSFVLMIIECIGRWVSSRYWEKLLFSINSKLECEDMSTQSEVWQSFSYVVEMMMICIIVRS